MLRDDGSVVVPGRAAEPLLRILVLALRDVRRNAAGGQLGADAVRVLYALHHAAVRHDEDRSSAGGTEVFESVSLDSAREWLTATQAAALLECSTRAVRKACSEGRLSARRVGERWLIDPDSIHRYGENAA